MQANTVESADPRRVTTSVSLYANQDYVRALKLVALRRGVTVGKMVRQILDETLKHEIEDAISLVSDVNQS